MSELTALSVLVAAGDEVAGTTQPTGRVAGPWAEYYEAIPGAGYGFWARLDGDSYVTVEFLDGDSDPTAVELEAQAIFDGSV